MALEAYRDSVVCVVSLPLDVIKLIRDYAGKNPKIFFLLEKIDLSCRVNSECFVCAFCGSRKWNFTRSLIEAKGRSPICLDCWPEEESLTKKQKMKLDRKNKIKQKDTSVKAEIELFHQLVTFFEQCTTS